MNSNKNKKASPFPYTIKLAEDKRDTESMTFRGANEPDEDKSELRGSAILDKEQFAGFEYDPTLDKPSPSMLWNTYLDADVTNAVVVKPRIDEVGKLKQELTNKGHEVKVFTSDLKVLLNCIANKLKIEGIDISDKVKNPNFRFFTHHDPQLSLAVSEALAKTVEAVGSTSHQKFVQKSVVKRMENADEFASNMFEIIQKLKAEEGIQSFRDTVKTLNDKGIATYRGGEWYTSTLQNLQKRWKELGLMPPSDPK